MLSEEEHSLLTESPAKEEGLEFFRSVVYKDVFTFNSHSECLHAIYYEAEKPSNIFVITCHGYTGSPEADSVFTGHYYRMGFNVLAPISGRTAKASINTARWAGLSGSI